MKDTKKTFATVNFALMNADAFGLLTTNQLAINARAVAFNAKKAATDKAREKAIKEGIDDKKARQEFVKKATAQESANYKAANERCNGLATAFIARYIGTNDCINGNLYNFDMKEFLTNIGVYTDGEDDKKALKRVNEIRELVVDRKDYTSAKLKNGETVLSGPVYKDIKNTPVELVAAIIYACVESGAIEFSEGGLSFVKH